MKAAGGSLSNDVNGCSSRVQTAASPCTPAIDRFSHWRQKPTRALANQNAYVPPAPIRTPRPSIANQDAWAVVTPKRTKANSATWARHVYTRTPHAASHSRLYHFQYKLLSPLFVFGQRAFLSLGPTTSHFMDTKNCPNGKVGCI